VIIGAHAIVYSTDPDADRAFLADVLGFPHVDAGGGWLIFRLPPAEVAVHPSDENGVHELYLMTDDVAALVASLRDRGIEISPIADRGWGQLVEVTLPGGGRLGIYEPRHPSPPRRAPRRRRTATKKKPATRSQARAKKKPARRSQPRGRASRTQSRSAARGRAKS
jgi:hypothetical protein